MTFAAGCLFEQYRQLEQKKITKLKIFVIVASTPKDWCRDSPPNGNTPGDNFPNIQNENLCYRQCCHNYNSTITLAVCPTLIGALTVHQMTIHPLTIC
jgi:hypothetical protein